MTDNDLTTPPDDCGCTDFATTRRRFLRNAAIVSSGTVAATMFGDTFRQMAYGATNANIVVVLSLRGGADFLFEYASICCWRHCSCCGGAIV